MSNDCFCYRFKLTGSKRIASGCLVSAGGGALIVAEFFNTCALLGFTGSRVNSQNLAIGENKWSGPRLLGIGTLGDVVRIKPPMDNDRRRFHFKYLLTGDLSRWRRCTLRPTKPIPPNPHAHTGEAM